MILPDFILKSRMDQLWYESGIDTRISCLDKKHFDNYPYQITYEYNSRGFRDVEWPDSNGLFNSIWCVGDSFTVGLGSPIGHTWPVLLKTASKRNTINISMDGASNDWIARKVLKILDVISPKNIVIQWSFLPRVESDEINLPDEERKKQYDAGDPSFKRAFNNFKKNFLSIETAKSKTNIIHSFIPNAIALPDVTKIWDNIKGTEWPSQMPTNLNDLYSLQPFIISELVTVDQFENFEIYLEYYELLRNTTMIEYSQIDHARDSFHYDIKTASKIVNEILPLLE